MGWRDGVRAAPTWQDLATLTHWAWQAASCSSQEHPVLGMGPLDGTPTLAGMVRAFVKG